MGVGPAISLDAAAIILVPMTYTLVKTMLTAWLGGLAIANQVVPGKLVRFIAGGVVVLMGAVNLSEGTGQKKDSVYDAER